MRNAVAKRETTLRVCFFSTRPPPDLVAGRQPRAKDSIQKDDRVDVAIATNMISVGLDISRLGLMAVLHVGETTVDQSVREFAKEFWNAKWPWPQRPKVDFDPRGIGADAMYRALQHAKCIVADGEDGGAPATASARLTIEQAGRRKQVSLFR